MAARDYAFNRLGLLRLTSMALPDNVASLRMLERIGCGGKDQCRRSVFRASAAPSSAWKAPSDSDSRLACSFAQIVRRSLYHSAIGSANGCSPSWLLPSDWWPISGWASSCNDDP